MKQKDAARKRGRTGAEGFEAFYGSLFAGRWPSLKAALGGDPRYVRLDFSREGCRCQPYYIDAASVCAALCLPLFPFPDGKVLDLCAAPGGKSLVLAGILPEGGGLHCNELSPERKRRLDGVIAASLPGPLAGRLATSCSDGAAWCRREGEDFSAILLDAPCSSERHVLGNRTYLAQWSAGRIKSLASRQWALLSSAWRLLKEGGCLLYATCALAPEENDGVLSRLFKKFPSACRVEGEELAAVFARQLASFAGKVCCVDSSGSAGGAADLLRKTFSRAEECGRGLQILPDRAAGAGPLYFSLLRKGNEGMAGGPASVPGAERWRPGVALP